MFGKLRCCQPISTEFAAIVPKTLTTHRNSDEDIVVRIKADALVPDEPVPARPVL